MHTSRAVGCGNVGAICTNSSVIGIGVGEVPGRREAINAGVPCIRPICPPWNGLVVVLRVAEASRYRERRECDGQPSLYQTRDERRTLELRSQPWVRQEAVEEEE